MKQINISLLQMPARLAAGNLTNYDRRCAHCCLRSHKDCTGYIKLGVSDCEPSKEFPEGSYFIKGGSVKTAETNLSAGAN